MRTTAMGVTLVEACVVVALCALIAALAAPSMHGVIVRQALRGRADELRTDLHFLRTNAIARSERLWFAVEAVDGGTCYVIHSGSAGDCSCDVDGRPSCSTTDAVALKAVGFRADGPVRLASNVDALAFEPARGAVTPTATLQLQSSRGELVKHIVSIAGRVRSCSPAAQVAGYSAC